MVQDEGSCRRHFSMWMDCGLCREWYEMVGLGRQFNLDRDETILGNGECIDGIYFVISGVLRLISFDSEGHEAILLYVTHGNLIGDSAFFNRMPVYALFSAVEDSSLCFFSRRTIESVIIPDKPNLLQNMLEYMAYKVGVLLHHQCEMVSVSVLGKVSRMIYDIAKYENFKSHFQTKITQQEMATALGLHRATFSKAVGKLKNLGILDWNGHQMIEVKDYPSLSMYSEDVFAL